MDFIIDDVVEEGARDIAREVCIVFTVSTYGACHKKTDLKALRSLSLSYQKTDGFAWPHPSFFWYDTDFSEFDSADIIDYILAPHAPILLLV